MGKNSTIFIYPLMIIGVLFILANSYKKKYNPTNNKQPQGSENSVTDIDGNIYHTITIGTQTWTVENLRTTHYRDGIPIPNVMNNMSWHKLTTGAYCNYNNISSNSANYGRLYNWYAISNSHNIAPTGFHVPTVAEWKILIDYVGGANVAGSSLKETGTMHWRTNKGATNSSGFTALPSGGRDKDGKFYDLGQLGTWWTATEAPIGLAWVAGGLYNSNDSRVGTDDGPEGDGWPVRCLRD